MSNKSESWDQRPFAVLGVCLALGFVLALIAYFVFGLSTWTAMLFVVLLGCPAVMIWGALQLRRPQSAISGPAPATKGVLIEGMVPFYDAFCRVMGLGRSFRSRTLALAELKPGARVLDAGCGTGVLTRLAADAVGPTGSAVGIDPGPRMIRRARANAARTGSRAQFELAVVEQLPFPDASFDAAFLSVVLHHLPPDAKRAGLAEIKRVLRPGGRLVVLDIDRPTGIFGWMLRRFRHHPTVGPHLSESIADLLRNAGFAAVTSAERWNSALAFWVAIKLTPAASATDRG